MEVTYKVSDLKKLISESSNEFKAKLGDGVESKDKDINGKAYKDAEKRAKDYDGGLQRNEEDWARGDAKYEKNDYNATMLDVQPENSTPEFVKRIKDLAIGGDKENEKIYNAFKKSGEEIADEKEDECKKGLVGRTRPEGYFKKGSAYKANESLDVARFKKTVFINEAHMKRMIPDDLKVEGKVFKMRDANDSVYLIEWKYNRAVVLEHNNPNGANESTARMKELMNYGTQDTKTTVSTRLNENDEKYAETLNKMRQILK